MSNIYCSIDSCHYWDQGNKCHANEILVSADSWAAQAPDNVDATQHASVPQMHVESCMETCCKTFVHKNNNQINVDGVTRV